MFSGAFHFLFLRREARALLRLAGFRSLGIFIRDVCRWFSGRLRTFDGVSRTGNPTCLVRLGVHLSSKALSGSTYVIIHVLVRIKGEGERTG